MELYKPVCAHQRALRQKHEASKPKRNSILAIAGWRRNQLNTSRSKRSHYAIETIAAHRRRVDPDQLSCACADENVAASLERDARTWQRNAISRVNASPDCRRSPTCISGHELVAGRRNQPVRAGRCLLAAGCGVAVAHARSRRACSTRTLRAAIAVLPLHSLVVCARLARVRRRVVDVLADGGKAGVVVRAYKINLAAMSPKTPASLQSRTYSDAYLESGLLPFAIGSRGSIAFVAQVLH